MISQNKLIRREIAEIQAYKTENVFSGIKLDAMESPWSGIDFRQQEIIDLLQRASSNLYPDSEQRALRKAVSNYFELFPEQLLFGNGSDELIALLMMAIGKVDDVVISVEPTFSVYRMQAIASQRKYVSVPLQNDFSLNLEEMLKAIKKWNPVLIFIAYPNNPTGNCFEQSQILQIVQAAPGLVVLDEAYYAFAKNDGFLSYIRQFSNLLVMHTFSKLGFAALRVGFLAGDVSWLSHINKVRLPYNINTLSQLLLTHALNNPQDFERHAKKVCVDRDRMYCKLKTMQTPFNLRVYPSDANFILFKVETCLGADNALQNHRLAVKIHQNLMQKGVLIRLLSTERGSLNGCLRVSVGAVNENAYFIQALQEILDSTK